MCVCVCVFVCGVLVHAALCVCVCVCVRARLSSYVYVCVSLKVFIRRHTKTTWQPTYEALNGGTRRDAFSESGSGTDLRMQTRPMTRMTTMTTNATLPTSATVISAKGKRKVKTQNKLSASVSAGK